MNNPYTMSPQRARERALFLYASALQKGDFDRVASVLKLAERDPILDRMIKDFDSLDFAPESRPESLARELQNGKGIHQVITIHPASPHGQPLSFDHDEEEAKMTTLTVPVNVDNPKTLSPFALRFITLAAAILIFALVGGLLIEMVNDARVGYPGSALQTEAPIACTAANVTDLNAESVRLAEAASALLETRAILNTPDEDRPAMFEQAGLLALCALQTAYSPEADTTLQRTLLKLGAVPAFPTQDWGFNTSLFSPDGQYLLIGGRNETALWDIASQTKKFSFPYDRPDDRVNPAAYSPDGKLIITYYQVGIVRVWDAETGKFIRDLDFGAHLQQTAPVLDSMAFSPDGKQVALGIGGTPVQMWDTNTWTMERDFDAGGSLSYSTDGLAVLTAIQGDTAVKLWDAATGEQTREYAGQSGGVDSAALSPDGKSILIAKRNGSALLLDTATGEQMLSFDGFKGVVNVVAFSPDGQYGLVGSADKSAKIFNLTTGAEVRHFTNDNYVASAAFSPDGSAVLIGSVDSNVRLWPTTIEGTIALACSKITRDFTPEERSQYGLGDGLVCP